MIKSEWKNNGNNEDNNEEIFSYNIDVKKNDAIQDKLWGVNKDNIRKYQDKLVNFLLTIDKDMLLEKQYIFEYSNPHLSEEELEPANSKLMELFLKSMPGENSRLGNLRNEANEWFMLFNIFVYPKIEYPCISCDDYKITENQAYLLAGLLCYSIVNKETKSKFFRDFQYDYNITSNMLNKIKELNLETKANYSNSFYNEIDYPYSEYDIYEILRQPQIKEIFKNKIDSLNIKYNESEVFSQIELMDGKSLDYVNPFAIRLWAEKYKYDVFYDLVGYAYNIVEIVKG